MERKSEKRPNGVRVEQVNEIKDRVKRGRREQK